MPGSEAMVEHEMLANGGDERAAKALVAENIDTGVTEIMARLKDAAKGQSKAA